MPMIRSTLLLLLALPAYAVAQDRIAVLGDSLEEARARYAAATDVPRDDCDLVRGGRWVCASFNDPVLADVADPELAERVPQDLPNSLPAIGAAVIGDSLGEARDRYSRTTSQRRVDCDPVGDGRWICASYRDPVLADLEDVPQPESLPEPESELVQPVHPTPVQVPGDALFQAGDLIVLNYNSCPDSDDLFAAVAGRMVLDRFGLAVGRDYIVNNGTCEDPLSRSNYIELSPRVFDVLYGEEGSTGTWLDAFGREDRSADITAASMAEALVQGRRVWVLEGGPSDFTFEVVQRLRAQGLSDSLKRVTVVEHSGGFNERKADPDNLAEVQLFTSHLRIPNGRVAGNGTAQLIQATFDDFVRPDPQLVDRYRRDRVYGLAWQAAFRQLDPIGDKFDGSDAVELLWIFGLREDQIADWYDFADRFLSRAVAPPAPTGLRAEVETASPVGGWQRTDDGLIWLGPDRYALRNRSDSANLAFTLNVPSDGRYRFTMRSRATPRGLTADRYDEEPPNDVWVTFGTRSWIKAFMARDGDWHVQAVGELSADNKSSQNLESDLPAGPVTVTISGRSTGHEIDWIELERVGDTASSPPAPAPEPVTAPLLVSTGVLPTRTPSGLSWADSYIGVDGQCWPASTFDHGIGDEQVSTPVGRISIREAARRLGSGPKRQGDLAFNQIACRADTPNDAGDEDLDQCPGLVTRGRDGCDLVADVPNWWDRL